MRETSGIGIAVVNMGARDVGAEVKSGGLEVMPRG